MSLEIYFILAGLLIQAVVVFLGVRSAARIAAEHAQHNAIELEKRLTRIETILEEMRKDTGQCGTSGKEKRK